MRKSNFSEEGNNPIQASTRINAARKYVEMFLNTDVKGYSLWFKDKSNNVTDLLCWEWHHSTDELTFSLHHRFPNQMPNYFTILALPSKISSWLTSLLRQLWEAHTTTTAKLYPGSDGRSTTSPLDAETSTWTNSTDMKNSSCLEHLLWLSERGDSRAHGNALKCWLKSQSKIPFHMCSDLPGGKKTEPHKRS